MSCVRGCEYSQGRSRSFLFDRVVARGKIVKAGFMGENAANFEPPL